MATLSADTGWSMALGASATQNEEDDSAEPRAARSATMRWVNTLSAAAPVIGLGVGAYLALASERRALGLTTLGGSLAFGLARWQLARFFTEQVRFETERQIGALEVRRYGLTVRAETRVEDATWAEALNEGFRRIAGYIFGANRGRARIQMTAPVIASVGEADRTDRNVAFIMPGNRALSQLPIPIDPRVHLYEVPGQRVAALPFRGSYGGDLPLIKRAELLRLVHAAGLTTFGDVLFAGYDAPSTLPLLRRNEVLVRIMD